MGYTMKRPNIRQSPVPLNRVCSISPGGKELRKTGSVKSFRGKELRLIYYPVTELDLDGYSVVS